MYDIDLLNANIPVPSFDGACRGFPTDWWFPEKHAGGQDKLNSEKAVEICNSCNSKNDCLNFSLQFMGVQGIWGGLSHRQRQRERTKRGVKVIR
jgi:hypothetical protein